MADLLDEAVIIGVIPSPPGYHNIWLQAMRMYDTKRPNRCRCL